MDNFRGRALVSRRQVIYRSMLMADRGTLFVFGDNLQRRGFGGQAGAMRGEPNAVGIPTKRTPRMDDAAFFTDDDFAEVQPHIDAAIDRLTRHLAGGGRVVLPAAGIGSGLAQLPRRSPMIHRYIVKRLYDLEVGFRDAGETATP